MPARIKLSILWRQTPALTAPASGGPASGGPASGGPHAAARGRIPGTGRITPRLIANPRALTATEARPGASEA